MAPSPEDQLALRVSALTVLTVVLSAGFIVGRVTAHPKTAPGPEVSSTRSTTQSTPGPWGELVRIPIKIEPPKELLPKLGPQEGARWFFAGHSPDEVGALMEAAGIEHDVVAGLRSAPQLWSATPEGTLLTPPSAFLMNIPARARTVIYTDLARSGRNRPQRDPIPVSPELLESFSSSGLAEATIAQFRSLLYGAGPWRLFADFSTAWSLITDAQERLRFARALLTADSFVMRVRLDPQTDIDRILAYWDPSGHSIVERPLVEALARVPGGADFNVLGFLPAMPRQFLNRYPNPADPVEPYTDCFWTALNFGADHPDGHVDDPRYVASTLRSRYQPTGKPPTLGDLIVLLDDGGTPIHAAVYLADDLVFTKNGLGLLHPWTVMRMPAMLDLYRTLAGSIRAVTVAPPGSKPDAQVVSAAASR